MQKCFNSNDNNNDKNGDDDDNNINIGNTKTITSNNYSYFLTVSTTGYRIPLKYEVSSILTKE